MTITEDGDNLIWKAGYVHLTAGDSVYDVLVESDGEWYTYNNAFHIYTPQEYADMNQEYNSSHLNPTNADTVLTDVPDFTVIDPTDD